VDDDREIYWNLLAFPRRRPDSLLFRRQPAEALVALEREDPSVAIVDLNMGP